MSDWLNRTNVTDWLRRAARRAGYPRHDCAAIVTEQSVIEVADVMSLNAVHGVVVQPADHPTLQVADGVVVVIPGDDFALWSVDRFHTRILWTTADTVGKPSNRREAYVGSPSCRSSGAQAIGRVCTPSISTSGAFGGTVTRFSRHACCGQTGRPHWCGIPRGWFSRSEALVSELKDWLARLEALDGGGLSSSHYARFRVAATSPIDVDDFLIRIDDTKRAAESFGTVPGNLSILTLLDAGDHNPYRDQALATQLGAVLTLAAGRRVRVAAGEVTTAIEGTDNVTFLPSSLNGRDLLGPIDGNIKRKLEKLLKDLAGLPSEDANAILAALELHYAATLLYDIDLNTAYTLVVAGLETLATHFEKMPTTWEGFIEADRWDAVFERLRLDETQRDALRAELLVDKHFKLRQRFAIYATRQLDPLFWRRAVPDFVPSLTMTPERSDFTGMVEAKPIPMEHLVPKDPDTLRRRLLAAYDARSRFVHTGAKGLDEDSAFVARSGRPVNRKEPLDFTGLRRILEWTLTKEIGGRAAVTDLPDVRLVRDVPKAGPAR